MLAGGSLLGVVSACAGEMTGAGFTLSPSGSGLVRGTVVDTNGLAQPVGRVYLLKKNGFNSGVYSDVDAHGKFDFGNVDVGDYQLRFWGSNLASVPEPLQNPVPVHVAAAETTKIGRAHV